MARWTRRTIATRPRNSPNPELSPSGHARRFGNNAGGRSGSAVALSGPLKIVLVEDEAFQRQVVAEFLGKNGLRITALASGADLKRSVHQGMPDLAILDVHLGEVEDGLSLARWLRARSSRVGIIMLTAATDTVDRVVGLESGADDYIAKPFEPRELLAWVRAVLRRAG